MRAIFPAAMVAAAMAAAPAGWAQAEQQESTRPALEAVTCYVPAKAPAQGAAQDGEASKPATQPRRPRPLDPADVETLTGRPYPAQMRPAPKPGHPLDPADVAVLTGKTSRPYEDSGRVTPYFYYPVTVPGAGSGYITLRTQARPLFVPRVFTRFSDPFFFVR